MNPVSEQIQEIRRTPEQRVIDRAVAIASENRVCNTSKTGRWLVGSQNSKTPNKWYVVEFSHEQDCFTCECKSWELNHTAVCKHMLACCFHEGRSV